MSRIIAIDAGHGLHTPGKRCLKSIDPNQTREWYLNDRIADRLEQLLSEYDCKVIRVDDTTGARDISLAKRCQTANNAGADIYISIHHNAGLGGRKGGGTVVFYYPSGSCKDVADRLYNCVVKKTGLRGNRSTPVANGKGLYVIRKTTMPAFLIENGFMDSPTDTPIILTAEHAGKSAQGILQFIVEEYKLEKEEGSTPETTPYYPAYKGLKTTLVDALNRTGINSSYAFRAKIARANGIRGYIGSYAQNVQMYNLLAAGLLKKAA